MIIRLFRSDDLPKLRRIAIGAIDGIAIDQNIEKQLGSLAGYDWHWRNSRQVDEDCEANPSGVFVAEENGIAIGFMNYTLSIALDL